MHVLMVTHWGLSVGVFGARFLPFSEVWFFEKTQEATSGEGRLISRTRACNQSRGL